MLVLAIVGGGSSAAFAILEKRARIRLSEEDKLLVNKGLLAQARVLVEICRLADNASYLDDAGNVGHSRQLWSFKLWKRSSSQFAPLHQHLISAALPFLAKHAKPRIGPETGLSPPGSRVARSPTLRPQPVARRRPFEPLSVSA